MGSIEIINARSGGGSVTGGDLNQNAIINPDGAVDQQQPVGGIYTAATSPANNDDTYLEDQWILLSDGNDVVDVSQETDSPDGSNCSMKYLVATANKKWGVLQIIENKESMPFDNGVVSMGFQVKTTAAKLINNVRCAILSWDSTADTVTSDVVSAWNAAGSDPTLVANWTYENTPANIAVTTSWVDDVSTVNVSIDTASMANIAVFIWVDDDDASVGDELFLSQRRMNEGATVLDYTKRRYPDELDLCQWHYEKWTGHLFATFTFAEGISTVAAYGMAYFQPKRTTPTFGFGGTIRLFDGANHTITNITLSNMMVPNPTIGLLTCVGTGFTRGLGGFLGANNDIDAYMEFKARL